eukprot:TRINITY_DN2827_c0_g1_i2.p1 TRINITY_DN2827_c0_g1~~TRINITY_DN2827_c0_g1_i2.p1  ORF type:complete len:151 (-),score=8.12 TRINITY_DN2827_c0_g1_i2:92-544(-)
MVSLLFKLAVLLSIPGLCAGGISFSGSFRESDFAYTDLAVGGHTVPGGLGVNITTSGPSPETVQGAFNGRPTQFSLYGLNGGGAFTYDAYTFSIQYDDNNNQYSVSGSVATWNQANTTCKTVSAAFCDSAQMVCKFVDYDYAAVLDFTVC